MKTFLTCLLTLFFTYLASAQYTFGSLNSDSTLFIQYTIEFDSLQNATIHLSDRAARLGDTTAISFFDNIQGFTSGYTEEGCMQHSNFPEGPYKLILIQAEGVKQLSELKSDAVVLCADPMDTTKGCMVRTTHRFGEVKYWVDEFNEGSTYSHCPSQAININGTAVNGGFIIRCRSLYFSL